MCNFYAYVGAQRVPKEIEREREEGGREREIVAACEGGKVLQGEAA